ncbi:hypothetical protein Ahia01_001338800 [Argonauta hians]
MASKGSSENIPINNRRTNSCGQAKPVDQHSSCSSPSENEDEARNDDSEPAVIKSESLNNEQIKPTTNRYQMFIEPRKSPPLQWRPKLQRAETLDSSITKNNTFTEIHSPNKRNYLDNHPRHQNGSSRIRANSISCGRIRYSDHKSHRSLPEQSLCSSRVSPPVQTKNVATSTSPPPYDPNGPLSDLDSTLRNTSFNSLFFHPPQSPPASPLPNTSRYHIHSKGTQWTPFQVSAITRSSPIHIPQKCLRSPRSPVSTSMMRSPQTVAIPRSPSPQSLMRVLSQDSQNKQSQQQQSQLQQLQPQQQLQLQQQPHVHHHHHHHHHHHYQQHFLQQQPALQQIQQHQLHSQSQTHQHQKPTPAMQSLPPYQPQHQQHYAQPQQQIQQLQTNYHSPQQLQQLHQQQQHAVQSQQQHQLHLHQQQPLPPSTQQQQLQQLPPSHKIRTIQPENSPIFTFQQNTVISSPNSSSRHQWNQVSLVRSQTISTTRSPLKMQAWNVVPDYARPNPFPASQIGTQQRIVATNQHLTNAVTQNICPENCNVPVVRHSLSVQSTPLNATRLIHTASTPCATAFTDSPMNYAGNQKWRIKHISYPSPDYSMLHKKTLENGSLVDQADNDSDVSDDVNSSSSDASICRICHEGESTAKLISPCYCTGSMGKLHVTCLERWLGSSYMNRCEICGYEYIVLRQPKPFIEFLKNPGTQNEKRHLMCDILCFFMLTPLAGVSIWLCLVGAEFFLQWDIRWEVPGLACLAVFLLIIYIVWCTVAFRYQYRIWTEWKCRNQTVQIKSVSEEKRNLPEIITNRNSNPIPPSDIPANLNTGLPLWCTLSSQTVLPHGRQTERIPSPPDVLPVPPPPSPPSPPPRAQSPSPPPLSSQHQAQPLPQSQPPSMPTSSLPMASNVAATVATTTTMTPILNKTNTNTNNNNTSNNNTLVNSSSRHITSSSPKRRDVESSPQKQHQQQQQQQQQHWRLSPPHRNTQPNDSYPFRRFSLQSGIEKYDSTPHWRLSPQCTATAAASAAIAATAKTTATTADPKEHIPPYWRLSPQFRAEPKEAAKQNNYEMRLWQQNLDRPCLDQSSNQENFINNQAM